MAQKSKRTHFARRRDRDAMTACASETSPGTPPRGTRKSRACRRARRRPPASPRHRGCDGTSRRGPRAAPGARRASKGRTCSGGATASKRAWKSAATGRAQSTATSSGRFELTPRTHAVSGRSASASKCTTCIVACTPVSVRPAAIVPTCASAITASARSSASCTPRPSGCDCQPVNVRPQYSSPRARRMIRNGDSPKDGELEKQRAADVASAARRIP